MNHNERDSKAADDYLKKEFPHYSNCYVVGKPAALWGIAYGRADERTRAESLVAYLKENDLEIATLKATLAVYKETLESQDFELQLMIDRCNLKEIGWEHSVVKMQNKVREALAATTQKGEI